jgi:hypothetical protein
MIRALRRYFAALKASSRLGRAYRLNNKGRKKEAVVVAREGLAILSNPFVERQNAAEGSTLACLTTLVEELSSDLNQPGASINDLKDSLKFIKQLPEASSPELQNMKAWVPYLEAKTGNASGV